MKTQYQFDFNIFGRIFKVFLVITPQTYDPYGKTSWYDSEVYIYSTDFFTTALHELFERMLVDNQLCYNNGNRQSDKLFVMTHTQYETTSNLVGINLYRLFRFVDERFVIDNNGNLTGEKKRLKRDIESGLIKKTVEEA